MLLFPAARDFSRGRFKLTSTDNGVPTNDDLVATLKRGMPGSAMPGWSWLSEEDLQGLATHVRKLAVEGIVEELRPISADSAGNLWERAKGLMTPGAPVKTPAPGKTSAKLLKQGEELFASHCASCHGADGRGKSGPQEQLNWPLDFTAGLLKGGATFEDLNRRIQVGMHGTSMPAANLDAEQRAAVVSFVHSLVSEASNDIFVQRRETLHVKRVEPGFHWKDADYAHIVLAPLWWKRGAILSAEIAAVHDGGELSIRIRWEDPTPNAPGAPGATPEAQVFTDAIALQLASDDNPPIFGMGTANSHMNIWHWKANYLPGTLDMMPLLQFVPHRLRQWFTEESLDERPLYQLGQGPIVVGGKVNSAISAGMRPASAKDTLPSGIKARASWDDGTWEVILSRALDSDSEREVGLLPGSKVLINFAIWNGSIQDLRGQKSVSIWHELELAP